MNMQFAKENVELTAYDYAKEEWLPASQVPPRSMIPQENRDDPYYYGASCQRMFELRLKLGDDEQHAALYVLEAITNLR